MSIRSGCNRRFITLNKALSVGHKVASGSLMKPTTIPSGFVLLVDTREQQPLFTHPQEGLKVEHVALPVGDYSVKGYETRVAVERKKLSDFYLYIGKERRRTAEKIKALSEMDWAALVIEATEQDLMRRYEYGKMTPEHARGFLTSLRVKWGIHVYVSRVRPMLERYILDHLTRWWEVYR